MCTYINGLIHFFEKPEVAGAIIGAIISVIGFLLISRNQNNIAEKNQEIQNKLIKENQFETTFLSLLEILRQLVNTTKGVVMYKNASSIPLNAPSKNNEAEGPAFFTLAAARLKSNMQASLTMSDLASLGKMDTDKNYAGIGELLREKAETVFNDFFYQHTSQLAHYFRLVYNIIKYVDTSEITEDKKKFYVNLIQAQMSSDELALLFYNGIGENGENFYKYMVTYNDFLQNIDTAKIFEPNFHLNFYPGHKFFHGNSHKLESLNN